MGIEFDPSPQLTQYAHPQKLVTSAWLGAKLGLANLKVLESDEDSLLYDIGHIPTAHRVNWSADLNDAVCRDFIDGQAFAQLMNARGISRDDTVVIYGDQSNLWSVYTLWVFELFGHPDVRLLDGGRDAWMQEEKETSYEVPNHVTEGYPVVDRDDVTRRVFADELQANLESLQILDLRSPEEFSGAAHLQDSLSVSRAGHIPGAHNLSITGNLHPNSRFRSLAELTSAHQQLDPSAPTVAYCSSGASAAHEWFTLTYLLGWDNVRVYDGSWTEWGNKVRAPIEH